MGPISTALLVVAAIAAVVVVVVAIVGTEVNADQYDWWNDDDLAGA